MPRGHTKTTLTGDSPTTLKGKQARHGLESAAERLKTFKDVAKPPIPLSKIELAYFNDLLKSRELSTWSPNDLQLAAIAAKNFKRLKDIEDDLMESGVVWEDEDGKPIVHANLHAYSKVLFAIRTLINTLGLSASTTGLTSPNQRRRNATEKKTREMIEDLESETDLI